MAGDVLSFALLAISSILIIVNPLGATLIYVSLTTTLDRPARDIIARDSCRFALFILLFVAVLGAWILQFFGISLEAFRIRRGNPAVWDRYGDGLCKNIADQTHRHREI